MSCIIGQDIVCRFQDAKTAPKHPFSTSFGFEAEPIEDDEAGMEELNRFFTSVIPGPRKNRGLCSCGRHNFVSISVNRRKPLFHPGAVLSPDDPSIPASLLRLFYWAVSRDPLVTCLQFACLCPCDHQYTWPRLGHAPELLPQYNVFETQVPDQTKNHVPWVMAVNWPVEVLVMKRVVPRTEEAASGRILHPFLLKRGNVMSMELGAVLSHTLTFRRVSSGGAPVVSVVAIARSLL